MILRNVQIVGNNHISDVEICGDKISSVTASGQPSGDQTLAFPGIINSHDHLEFNNFPQLGNRKYANYTEWAHYIHAHHKDEIREVLKIPEQHRTQYGILKNMFCGVTTVVNHGKPLPVNQETVKVLQNTVSLHSVKLEHQWKWKLNKPFTHQPIAIHIGEGTDASASDEIDLLIRWNIFKRKLIGIHAVSMSRKQAAHFEALVWCPASNDFMFDSTAAMDLLKSEVPVLFGTDSTLTAGWNLWQHLRLARSTQMLTDRELFESLNIAPARIWGLPLLGRVQKGYVADIVIARKKEIDIYDAFFAVDPEDILLVMREGKILLCDAHYLPQSEKALFTRAEINGIVKYVSAC